MNYFSEMLPVLSERAKYAANSYLRFANEPLTRHLSQMFDEPFGRPGAFLADPTFEAVFGWETGDKSMADLAGNLLTKEIVNAMDKPPKELAEDYRFAKDQKPYKHQIKAWDLLSQPNPNSIVVASGTGSGKTECFMVPILDRLARQRAENQGKLSGVRALFLYPLNALINSQRERLRAWTSSFGNDVRFCLYNGNTPETLPTHIAKGNSSEVVDRKTLRKEPSPILVTNATMLEYMLVRTADAPIIEKSQGKLEWVVLDEAHTYIGSQAAEMALLIRRVLLAFGVRPENVRFVATSATIGDPEGEGGEQLRRFLAEISGVSSDRIQVVAGKRAIPDLLSDAIPNNLTLEELRAIDPLTEISQERYEAICANPTAQNLRKLFVGDPNTPSVARLSAIATVVCPSKPETIENAHVECLKWLDLLSGTRDIPREQEGTGEPFLPLRGHIFHRTFSGVWACSDVSCSERDGTPLSSPDWPFGIVYFDIRNHCSCGSPVYEVVRCDGCGEAMLLAGIDSEGTVGHLSKENVLDEFELDIEIEGDETEEESLETLVRSPSCDRLLVVNKALEHVEIIRIDRDSRKLTDSIDGSLALYAKEDGGTGLACPSCGIKESSRNRTFMSSRIGAPYFLGSILPTLLEYAPDGDRPADHPCRGRRLLSFNDSRQGTARIAARLQQESERNRVRGLLYHLVLSARSATNPSQINEVKELIELLSQAHERGPTEQLALRIESEKQKLNDLKKPRSISFSELANNLANSGTDFDKMLGLYNIIAGDTFQGPGSSELARMFLVREFGRRPKKSNNLETMGLVAIQYPGLEVIRDVPKSIREISDIDLAAWKDLLKICLDFFVRANGALEINRDWRKWIGVPFPQSFLVDQDSDGISPNQKRWPRAKRSGRMSTIGALVAYVLKANLDLAEDEDRIDIVLRELWGMLCSAGLLSLRPNGRVLALDQLSFSLIEKGYICPVTRRVLDTTFKGVTPYIPVEPRSDTTTCETITLPIYDSPFSGTSDELERIRLGRQWLRENSEVAKLRSKGIWSSFHDRTIELSLYYTTAEHSAQQDSSTLEWYEKRFKSGDLNLLSCSTTMEMGIDIGGIAMVAMNNVPPHPANYLQRAGRAGRRRELRSTSMTLCKTNPHDLAVFRDSRWAFDSELPAPKVSLDSPTIVQRHVNSFLLSRFLSERLTNTGQESIRLTCGSFFLGDNSLSSQFPSWVMKAIAMNDSEISPGLKELVRGSIFDGRSMINIATDSSDSMINVATKWISEWNQLESDLSQVKSQKDHDTVAVRAIELHRSRLTDEYLLRELSARGFLPAHGFPTNIASFDSMTVGQFKRIKNASGSGREDNRLRRREMASRDIATALREYAPGSEIVLDGLVYKSSGVTLNWHIPAEQVDVNEIQEIRYAFRCRKCGASHSSPSFEASLTCIDCGNTIESEDRIQFLEPAGFAVDFYDDPTNDISSQKFLPVEDPWINASGPWLSLPNPTLGRFRVTTQGHIFHKSSGIHGFGYAICLECGRAEPMTDKTTIPVGFQKPHRKLRRSKNESTECPGSSKPWKIKKPLLLGSEGWTDILELQLRSEHGAWLDEPTAANTICVALRDSIAEELGVQSSELGCQIKQSRLETGGSCRSLIIYDRFAAGYSSGAERFLSSGLRAARARMVCSADCDSACPSCVLSYDQRFSIDKLNRNAGLRFLSNNWVDGLRLPDIYQYFGPDTQNEPHSVVESILNQVGLSGASGVRLFTAGPKSDWDTAPSSLRELAYRLAGRGTHVEIVLPGALDEIRDEDRHVLASLSDHPQIDIRAASEPVQAKNGWVIAETISEPSARWAVDSIDGLSFTRDWGSTSGPIVKTNLGTACAQLGEVHTSARLRPSAKLQGDKEIEISSDLDGPISQFGAQFWNKILSEHDGTKLLIESGKDPVVGCTYSDRYLFSPVSVAVLFFIIKGLKSKIGSNGWEESGLKIRTARKQGSGDHWGSGKIWSDWQNDAVREQVLRELFKKIDVESTAELRQNSELEHSRVLEIKFSSGKLLRLRLDQGVGYWRVAQSANSQLVSFNFNSSVVDQCSRIYGLSVRVEGREMPTQLFLTER